MTSSLEINVVHLLHGNLAYEQSLDMLLEQIQKSSDNTLVAAPELFLSGFDYDDMSKASQFTEYAISRLLEVVSSQIVVFTAIVFKNGKYENEALVLHNHKIVHRQSKRKLFKLGAEDSHFASGLEPDELVFSINGVKYALLICFEIRFTPLWEKIREADVILVPAQWGILREQHIIKLSQALAIANQCFVVLCSSGESGKIANIAATYNPDGEMVNDSIEIKEVAKMRRYIDMGRR